LNLTTTPALYDYAGADLPYLRPLLHKTYVLISTLGITLFLAASPAQAQNRQIFVSQLSEKDGLTPGGVMNFFEDDKGYLWLATIAGLNRFDGHEMITYTSEPGDLNSLSTTSIHDITQDHSGKLWIATRGGGLNSFDPDTEEFTHYRHATQDATSGASDDLTYIDLDDTGKIWVGSQTALTHFDPATGQAQQFYPAPGQSGQLQGNCRGEIIADTQRIYLGTSAGFEYYDRQTGLFRFFPLIDSLSKDTIRYQVYGMARDSEGKIWFGTPNEGLRVYDPETDTVSPFNIKNSDGHRNTRPMRMLEDNNGALWIAGYFKVWKLSPDRSELKQLEIKTMNSHTPFSSGIWSIYQDRSGLIWFGSPANQALYFDPRGVVFEFNSLAHNENDRILSSVECLTEDSQGRVWLGMENNLYAYDRETGKYQVYPQNSYIYNLTIGPRGWLWLATETGVFRFNTTSGKSTPLLTPATTGLPVYSTVYAAFDQEGDLWITSSGTGLFFVKQENLYRIDITSPLKFKHWKSHPDQANKLPTDRLRKVMADSKGNIWICGNQGGISRINKRTGQLKTFNYVQGKPGTISNDYTFSVVEGPDGNIWVSSRGGLNRFSPETEQFTHYLIKDGLPSNTIFDLVFDADGFLWMNTTKGISYFDIQEERFTNFYRQDGLQCWLTDLYYNWQSNTIYTAGNKGFNRFSPSELRDLSKQKSIIQIVGVSHFDPKEKTMVTLRPDASSDHNLDLSHSESSLRIQFAIMDFRSPNRHRYRYALGNEEGEFDWIELGARNQVDFAQLDPGDYQFRLAGQNSDGLWSELAAPLEINIRPPFWQTGWAYLLYTLLFAGAFYFIYHFNLKRKLAIQEAQQSEAISELKSKLYTNIAHEFRTPLTVILGMTEKQSDTAKAMSLIRRNGQKLLHLVNQLLDLTKINIGELPVHYQQIEIVSFTNYLEESFQSLAQKKRIRLIVYSEMDELWLDMDEEKYRQIISNLLGNAIKFTPENGKVVLHLARREDQLMLKIKDNGMGIAEAKLPYIFDRFYQVDHSASLEDKGTGIGLALVKELTELMDGTIEVSSKTGKGTTFTIKFPIRNDSVRHQFNLRSLDIAPTNSKQVLPSDADENEEGPFLLIIEDNLDVLSYLQSLLNKKYNLLFAKDGKEGIHKAIQKIPDIIISDVMMPESGGFEVLNTLKNDERTSHIPIILLTAKSAQKDKIEGLQRGADAYIEKPFDQNELLIRLDGLIQLRKKLQQKYTESSAVDTAAISPDERFLQKLYHLVKEHLGEADFTVEQLAQAADMSHTQLYRKLKALTNQTPSEYIRHIRLTAAKHLLLNSQLNISEIAYEVGFNSPNYFARVFSKSFGKSPNQFRNQL